MVVQLKYLFLLLCVACVNASYLNDQKALDNDERLKRGVGKQVFLIFSPTVVCPTTFNPSLLPFGSLCILLCLTPNDFTCQMQSSHNVASGSSVTPQAEIQMEVCQNIDTCRKKAHIQTQRCYRFWAMVIPESPFLLQWNSTNGHSKQRTLSWKSGSFAGKCYPLCSIVTSEQRTTSLNKGYHFDSQLNFYLAKSAPI